jgi:Mg2+ and Co2+ transporter CorA
MLVDRPFQLHQKYGSIGQAEYRNPNLRPKASEEFHGDETRQSFKQAFCCFLKQRCSADEIYLRTCATDTFLILYEGYRVIASEWLVVNEYVKRELANIERRLETKESTFQELEQYLKELYRIRRRCNKDRELVTEAASQCEKRGQALWPSSKGTPHGSPDAITSAKCHAEELEEDFKYVLNNMSINISRIEKDINLLMALVAISEGRQSLQENRGIKFLSLVATLFLPSSTVATVLGIQTQYGPGAHNFWMLWAVALPLTILITTIPFLYSTATTRLKHPWAKCFPAKLKTAFNTSSASQDAEVGGIELSQDRVVRWMHQTSIGGMV